MLQTEVSILAAILFSQVVAHMDALVPANALALVRQYDVVVDASDNAPTRYLLSDACVIAGRPLVSGAALGTDGQLTVYNHGPDGTSDPALRPNRNIRLPYCPSIVVKRRASSFNPMARPAGRRT